MISYVHRKHVLLATFSLLLAACALEGDDLDGDGVPPTVAPIASLTIDGRTVEWLEPVGGLFAFGETGPASGISLVNRYPDLAWLPPTEQWSLLTTRPVPAELVDYERRIPGLGARTRPARHDGSLVIDRPTTTTTAAAGGSCSSTWFANTFCKGYFDFEYCLLNWGNGAWSARNNLYRFTTAACADLGDITLRVQMNGSTVFQYTALQGQYRYYDWYGGYDIFGYMNDEDFRSDVLNASNDRFHYESGGWID